jgi:TRAP-type C4-dicarboxylate transport system permease small subunit
LLLIFILAMTLLIVWQVLCRYVLHISTSYAEELARLSVVWCIFLGGALAVRKQEHMCVEALYNILPRSVKYLCDVISYALMLVLSAVMLYFGVQYCIKTSGDFRTSFGYSISLFYVPCAIAGAQIFIYTLANLIMSVYSKITKKDIHFE